MRYRFAFLIPGHRQNALRKKNQYKHTILRHLNSVKKYQTTSALENFHFLFICSFLSHFILR